MTELDASTVESEQAATRRLLLVKSTPLTPEDRHVLGALVQRARAAGMTVSLLLLGTASYAADSGRPAEGLSDVELWALEEEVRGRGIRPSGGLRLLGYPELVGELFGAGRVIQLP